MVLTYQRKAFRTKKTIDITPIPNLNILIEVNPNFGYIDQCIYHNGIWEKAVTQCFIDNIKRDHVILDIGSNIGYYTLIAARLVGDKGHVFTFEPQKQIYQALSRSIEANQFQNTTPYNLALGKEAGQLIIHHNLDNRGASSLFTHQNAPSMENSETVKMEVLDDLLLSQVDRLDLVKIDVEGFEVEVLAGAHMLFNTFKPVCIFEYSPSFWKSNQMDWYDQSKSLFNFFFSKNYTLKQIGRRIELNSDNIHEYIMSFKSKKGHVDIFAKPL